VKQQRVRPALSEHQQVAIAIILVILLASSVLYCLGFGSVVARQLLESRPPAAGTPEPGAVELELTPVITMTLTPAVTTTLPAPAGTPF
jgi:hypothetical protein